MTMAASSPRRVVGTLTGPESLAIGDAVLEPTDSGLRATGVDGFAIEAPWRRIRVSERLEGIERTVRFPDGRVFQSTDDDGIDGLLPSVDRSRFAQWRQLAEHRWKVAIGVVAAAGLAIVLVFNALIPVLADVAAHRTPIQVDTAIGRSALGSLAGITGPSRTDAATRQALERDFRELAGSAGFAPGRVTLRIVDGRRVGANALAVPGGTVILTDQMIAVAENRDELIGVLAHELGHLHHRHGIEKVYRGAAVSAFLFFLIGGDGGLTGLAGLGAGLLSNAYSRDMEREADDYAVRLLSRTGYDPTAFGRLLVRLEDTQGGATPGLLRTHPVGEERLRRMRDLAGE